MIEFNVCDSDSYFQNHQEKDEWISPYLSYEEKKALLKKAEMYINNSFDLRNGVKGELIYLHAIYEQAIFLLTFDKERSRLQREGVVSYKVEDMSFTMTHSIISPVTKVFLKKHIYKKVGKIT